ncbi:piggyBac transposable element-derived protein 4-like [Myxocyprinus asiaticus]|uniref:piggyBac transposable element-derived protein 4-like n=1 Tax=Myxocyprinus asiaticus TaxID=70543 RepID=UPI002222B4D9|nr:piggyBac transposable element-derived protein 4-like [Myxocyprinus asiaticus]
MALPSCTSTFSPEKELGEDLKEDFGDEDSSSSGLESIHSDSDEGELDSGLSSEPLTANASHQKRKRTDTPPEDDLMDMQLPAKQEAWKDSLEPDPGPLLLQFRPARPPGVHLDKSSSYSPLELFQLYFSVQVVETLCENTNKNGLRRYAQGKRTPWFPLTIQEMFHYLGLLIFMGLLRTRKIRDHWSNHRLYKAPFCSSVMARYRFEAITWTLHMSDPEHDKEYDKLKGTPSYDKLCRLRPLMDSILDSCRAYYHPTRNISIDERMVASKARIGMKQYMRNKPTRWGFKLFVLADSNGYTCDFNIYTGKSLSRSGKGLGYDAVKDLLHVKYLGSGYHLYVDNFYTSRVLFLDLYKMHFGACGTVRENRQGCLKSIENPMPKNAERGSFRWIRDGNLLFCKWRDTKDVTMCSTIHKAYTGGTVLRRIRNADGSWSKRSVPVPEAVKEYNKFMGGVDLSDALLKYYCIGLKTKKWYKTLFYHFVEIAVVNSFLMHKVLEVEKNRKPLTHKVFREQLCLQLVDFSFSARTPAESPAGTMGPIVGTLGSTAGTLWSTVGTPGSTAGTPGSNAGTTWPTASTPSRTSGALGSCYPIPMGDPASSGSRKNASKGRRRCRLCKEKGIEKTTIWQCDTCLVPLCLIPDRNCFREWHVQK